MIKRIKYQNGVSIKQFNKKVDVFIDEKSNVAIVIKRILKKEENAEKTFGAISGTIKNKILYTHLRLSIEGAKQLQMALNEFIENNHEYKL